MTIRHMNINVEGMRRIIAASRPMLPAQKEILPLLMEAHERGQKYISECNTPAPDGSCPGHEERMEAEAASQEWDAAQKEDANG